MSLPRTTAAVAAVGALLLLVSACLGAFGLLRGAAALLPLGVLLLLASVLLSLRAVAREVRTLRSNASRSHALLVDGLADLAARSDRAVSAARDAGAAAERAVAAGERAEAAAAAGRTALSDQLRAGHGSTVRALRGMRQRHADAQGAVLRRVAEARDALAARLDTQTADVHALAERSGRVEEAVLARPIARQAGDLLLEQRRPGPLQTTLTRAGVEEALGGTADPLDLVRWDADDTSAVHGWGGVLIDLDEDVPVPLLDRLRWARPDVPVLGFTRLPFDRDRLAAGVRSASGGRLVPVPAADGVVRFHPGEPGEEPTA